MSNPSSAGAAPREPSLDETFHRRIQNAVATVEAWDADPTLLAECRLMIPFEEIVPELMQLEEKKTSPYARDHDVYFLKNPDLLLLQRLAVFFQKDVMTWVSKPECSKCKTADHMEHGETRGPSTVEEREGGADRVEVYRCQQCQQEEFFPRYNSPRKLLETRRGRCGEYANLFGLYCRAVGYETRYVSDWTDHVWVECRMAGTGIDLGDEEWIMADSCEGTIQKPSMYEQGWGKQLNYIVGVTKDAATDVTPYYTRQFHTEAFQQRRRQITSSEAASAQIIAQVNRTLRQSLPSKRVEELERREKIEHRRLEHCKSLTVWTQAEKHGRGRISGSLEWKLARHEAGSNSQQNKGEKDEEKQNEGGDMLVQSLFVEQYYLVGNDNHHVDVVVRPSCDKDQRMAIQVQGVSVHVDGSDATGILVVVLDDDYVGCILQSRCLPSWKNVADFVSSLPKGRIVVMAAKTASGLADESTQQKFVGLLGGFQMTQDDDSEGMVFIGQVETNPSWTVCQSYSKIGPGVVVKLPIAESAKKESFKLRTECNAIPQTVAGRLPESVMPLATQLLATETQKRTAFLTYADKKKDVMGYTTKHGSPVYLLNNGSIPFSETTSGWNTFHFLPTVLVPDDDNGAQDASDKKSKATTARFDVPLEENVFTSLLGPTLVTKSTGTDSVVPCASALHNSRLIGLYFSAHWCPPCRQFTPMLIEAYQHLKEEFPSHGLEMVFVSSDRATNEFQSYHGTMPWCAVPFTQHRMVQQQISMQFGVRGIPALVVLDAMSGQVVASIEQARGEVAQACQRGEQGIEQLFQSWLSRIPTDSQELYNLLDVSCDETKATDSSADTSNQRRSHPYLVRSSDHNDNILQTTSSFGKAQLDNGVSQPLETTNPAQYNSPTSLPKESKTTVLMTILKYLENALREPWTPKFRQFKLSNKIVDRAAREPGSLEFIRGMGMQVIPSSGDFALRIPLATNLERMKAEMDAELTNAS